MVVVKHQTEGGQYADESNRMVDEGPGTAYGFPDMSNQGNINNEGTSDEKYWATMVKYEVQDHLNKADQNKNIQIEDIYQ